MKKQRTTTEALSPDGPARLLGELCRLVAERAPAEKSVPADLEARAQAEEEEYQEARQRITQEYEQQKAATEQEYAKVRRQIGDRFASDHTAAKREYEEVRAEVLGRFKADHGRAEDDRQETRWEAQAICEAAQGGSDLEINQIRSHLDARWQELKAIQQQAVEVLHRRGQWREYPDPQPSGNTSEADPIRHFDDSVVDAKQQLEALVAQRLPRVFEGAHPLWGFLALWLLSVFPAGWIAGFSSWHWAALSSATALVLSALLGGWLYYRARLMSSEAYLVLKQTLIDAGLDRPSVLDAAKALCERRYAAVARRCQRELKRADEGFAARMEELRRRKTIDLAQADRKYPALLEKITARRDREQKYADGGYAQRLAEIEQDFQTRSAEVEAEHSRAVEHNEQRYRGEWDEMAQRWHCGLERFQSSLAEISAECDRLFPDWNSDDWSRFKASVEIPPVVCFGCFSARLDRIKKGIPRDERLRPAQTEYALPAVLPFPSRSTLLLQSGSDGRAAAVQLIQSLMLRLLTAIPPGRVRFTIIDPVGLGENFSAFMHLADYDEQLVASRIWTDGAHIEHRLGDLTEHMENVIQLYLRNEFDSIDEYNELAGEIAEPYRVLVIANFPANFTEAAAHRLASIVASGARCGVFTVMSLDDRLPLPRGFDPADLKPYALTLRYDEGQFLSDHPDYGALPLSFPSPPSPEQFTEIVRHVGQQVQEADKVEVPFSTVAPQPPERWTSNSRDGIDVPLGRAGAMKLQPLRLGPGTSQHVLVSGKTGSGKSTLWHALITNLALRYSPDQVELYLVDFKKGVEFKTYANWELPHARVIAIESEREFGLSVLERLDAELKHRGDLFRKLGAQDLKAYRDAKPNEALPRVLLIVDEFQELFVEDDRIAQDAALLLDRLVRQGRAFGIHVLLGSQTLAGAYSLARATIGQMAVRIALQCSEADAHLILSEENTAARLLRRPGEAIYNDANGLYEGNHPFQVVWLPEHERDAQLKLVRELAQRQQRTLPPPIVFEGNVPADPTTNVHLRELLAAKSWPQPAGATRAWLGAAVAIKEPTAAKFLRQNGSNLLLVGHREEAALGVLATCLVSLAAQEVPFESDGRAPACRFFVLDGTRPDAPEAGFFRQFAPVLPHATRVVGPRQVGDVIGEVADELARRDEQGIEVAPRIYLVVYNLGRFRDLRKDEDDFSFSRLGDEEKPPSPARQFGRILREGPALGIHTLMWCDTYNSVTRSFERSALHDVEMRVLFHMNATDSSSLTDSPAASKLGIHRAVLYDEGEGVMEKFRPYGLPPQDWLAWVKKRLHKRSKTP